MLFSTIQEMASAARDKGLKLLAKKSILWVFPGLAILYISGIFML